MCITLHCSAVFDVAVKVSMDEEEEGGASMPAHREQQNRGS